MNNYPPGFGQNNDYGSGVFDKLIDSEISVEIKINGKEYERIKYSNPNKTIREAIEFLEELEIKLENEEFEEVF